MFLVLARLPIMMILLVISLGTICPSNAFSLMWKMPPDEFVPLPQGQRFNLAADPQGNAFSAVQNVSTNSILVARFSKITQSYGAPVTVFTGTFGRMSLATDASETALLVWLGNGGPTEVLSAFYNGTTWVTPTPNPIGVIGAVSAGPEVDMDGHGNGLAIWTDAAGITAPGDILVSFFNAGSQTWGSSQTLNPLGTGGTAPSVNYSSNETAVAVWTDGSANLIASNFNGTTWTALPPTIATNARLPDVQIDAAGHALVVWQDTFTGTLFSNYFDGTTWGPPQNISVVFPVFRAFALAPSGTAIAVFSDAAGNAYYSEFIAGIWTVPVIFATNLDPATPGLSVAVDSVGNGLLAWADETSSSFSIYKPFGGPLGAPDIIVPNALTLSPGLAALSDNGRGFVTGTTTTTEGVAIRGTYTLFLDPTSPVISGSVCNNKFASQTDRIHIISWLPSPDPAVTSYVLRRNGNIIAIIPATGPLTYQDHNRCKKPADTYTVVAVSLLGESLPAVIVLQ